ncbi:PREDICTED: amiloride-sensitive sodium channel subunit delta [Elephantulus edwardii]|uniref:amiloride-sensitive sodium channel subunit delta n=1 Tax=Elephantulus edwardii TaxID=28737 RepID=UPI0003F09032|nr:PREDICTED: amiloride-sensitive sodium channel subunit delta [Elephantulus edwardii]
MDASTPASSDFKAGDGIPKASEGPVTWRYPQAQLSAPPLPQPLPPMKEHQDELEELHTSFTELFTFFCANTTIHGPRHLVSRSRLRRVTWGLLLLGALGMFCHHLQKRNNDVTHGDSKPSLAITLCDMNPHRLVRQHLEELDKFARENIYSLIKFNISETSDPTRTTPMDKGPSPESTFRLARQLHLQMLKEPGRHSKVGFRLCNSTGGDCFNRTFSSREKAIREWYHFHYMNILAATQEHSYKNPFILSCENNQQDCEAESFYHHIYGNCYTFNDILASTHQHATQSEERLWLSGGITLVLRVEPQDHLPLLSSDTGIKVTIHKRNHTPFLEPPFLEPRVPESQIFNILPRTETTISIGEESWFPNQFASCVDGEKGTDMQLLYNKSYTRQACLVSCFQHQMVKDCFCGYYRYPLPAGAEYCTSTRYPAWGHCFYSLYQELETRNHSCFSSCPRSCRSSIAKVNINWRLNYFKMERTPKEGPILLKLLEEMKNLMGQCFGMSMLSVMELLELLFDSVALSLLLGYRWLYDMCASRAKCSTKSCGKICPVQARLPASPEVQKVQHLANKGQTSAMIIPMRCVSCGKIVGNKWEAYLGLLQAECSEADALDALGLKCYCCRRMLLAHVDLIEKLLNYAPLEK